MQLKRKQTKCENNRRTLTDYSFLSCYHYTKSKNYLKRRLRIRHWIPMFIGTPCTIPHDGYSLQGSSIDHPIKSDHIGNRDLAFMINDINCNKVPISVSKCEKRWNYLGLFTKDCWNIVILEFYIHLCPDSNCCFEINVNLWILWINSRL